MPTIAEQWKSEGREEGLEIGLEKGREEGREEGKLMGQVKAYQELLGITVMTPEEMLAQSTESLQSLVEQLKSRCQQ
jgi:flagellar biosynthesis/type III secretory pathway protein FliH